MQKKGNGAYWMILTRIAKNLAKGMGVRFVESSKVYVVRRMSNVHSSLDTIVRMISTSRI